MNIATIFSVTAEAFAMGTTSGAVILATCDGDWVPAVGMQLEDVRVDVGPCTATIGADRTPAKLTAKVRSNHANPTYWGGLE